MFKDLRLTFVIIMTMFFNHMIWFFHSLANQIFVHPPVKQILFFVLYAVMAYGVLNKTKWSYFLCLAYSLYVLTFNAIAFATVRSLADFMTPTRFVAIALNILLPLSIYFQIKNERGLFKFR